jgi:hypothetical protein
LAGREFHLIRYKEDADDLCAGQTCLLANAQIVDDRRPGRSLAHFVLPMRGPSNNPAPDALQTLTK